MSLSTSHSRFFVFTLAAMLAGCTGKPPAAPVNAAPEVAASGGINYGLAALPPPACRLGDDVQAPRAWVEANGAGVQRVDGTRVANAGFPQAVAAVALRAVIDKEGLRQLARVEFQDDGGWHEAWAGTLSGQLAQGCEQAWFGQRLDAKGKTVHALRFSFRPAAGEVAISHAALQAG